MEPDPIDSDKVTKAPPKPAAFQHPLARHPYLLPDRDPNHAMLHTVRLPGKESEALGGWDLRPLLGGVPSPDQAARPASRPAHLAPGAPELRPRGRVRRGLCEGTRPSTPDKPSATSAPETNTIPAYALCHYQGNVLTSRYVRPAPAAGKNAAPDDARSASLLSRPARGLRRDCCRRFSARQLTPCHGVRWMTCTVPCPPSASRNSSSSSSDSKMSAARSPGDWMGLVFLAASSSAAGRRGRLAHLPSCLRGCAHQDPRRMEFMAGVQHKRATASSGSVRPRSAAGRARRVALVGICRPEAGRRWGVRIRLSIGGTPAQRGVPVSAALAARSCECVPNAEGARCR